MPRTDHASRVVAAPADRVFAAMVDEEAMARWLPPGGMTGSFEHFDARPGGSYRMALSYSDGPDSGDPRGKTTADTDVVDVRFVLIVEGERIVQAVDFDSDDPVNSGTMTMTWRLTPVEGGTRVEIRADNVPDGISAAAHAAGLASSLEQLASYVETSTSG